MDKEIKNIKKITKDEIVKMSNIEASDFIHKCVESIFGMRIAISSSKLKNTHLVSVQKKNIARVLTYKRSIK